MKMAKTNQVPFAGDELESFARAEVAGALAVGDVRSIASFGCEEFAFLARLLASTSHRSVLPRVATLFAALKFAYRNFISPVDKDSMGL